MGYPISPYALNYVRARATDVMNCEVQIVRQTRPDYDETTLVGSPGETTVIYTGRCRIWEVTTGGTVVVGENDISMQSTQLSIPWSTTPVPHKDDEGTVLASPLDEDMVGRRFQILDVAKAGQLRATRRFTIQFVQAKR